MRRCLYCDTTFVIKNSWDKNKKKFCNASCSGKFYGKLRGPMADVQKTKISAALKLKYRSDDPPKSPTKEEQSRLVGAGTKNKFKGKYISTLKEASSRTVAKILKRMNIGCSVCGWNEATCDIHHINGRTIEGFNNHSNLTLLCPNCHRLFHAGKIKAESLRNFDQLFGDEWRNHYYG